MSDAPEKAAGTASIGISAETRSIGGGQDRGASDNAPRRERFIYAITNETTGKRYVGCTVSTKTRWAAHRSGLRHDRHWCQELQADWNELSWAAFSFTVLERGLLTELEAKAAEIKHIAAKPCYNYQISNEAGDNFTITSLAKEHHAEMVKAAWADPSTGYHRQTTSRWDDPAQKVAASKRMKAHYSDPAERQRQSETMKAAQTEAIRKRKSETQKIIWADPNSPQRKAIPKRKMSEEGRAAKAAKMAAFWASPDGLAVKARRSEALARQWADPDSKFRNQERFKP